MDIDDPRHGTWNGYQNQKCRCIGCAQAALEYRRTRTLRVVEAGLPEGDPRHGTSNGYGTIGCRCDLCTDYSRMAHVMRKFGLTPEAYDALLESQGGVCAICKSDFERTPHVDHDHECCPSGQATCGSCVRGLLCFNCNWMLGYAKDNVAILIQGADYLRTTNATRTRYAA